VDFTKVGNQDIFLRNHFLGSGYEAKKNLVDPPNKHLTILGIAFEIGFNFKASFNRIFKNYTGQTPSEFLSSQEK